MPLRGLISMGFYRNGISSHAEHVGKKFLGQAECIASDHVLGLQEPAASRLRTEWRAWQAD
jgi:hypothetical protein